MTRCRIAVLDDYQNVARTMTDWRNLPATEVEFFHDTVTSVDALAERLAPFDVLILMRERTRIGRALMERLPKLRLIVGMSAGPATLDADAAEALGIEFRHVPVSPSGPMGTATLTWGLIIALARQIVRNAGSVREGGWQVGMGIDLHGKTLGIVGLGNVGNEVARLGNAFGMNVIAWSANMTPSSAAAAGAARVDKPELFETADIVSLHLRLSERTRHLVDGTMLRAMKPTAFLINTSRAALVDENELVAVLERNGIAGAALDVFDREPLPADHPLRTLPNVIATPHIGYVTLENYRAGYTAMADAIRSFLAADSQQAEEIHR